jgi:3D (Asp-Asp-Asp) domain-containing protein
MEDFMSKHRIVLGLVVIVLISLVYYSGSMEEAKLKKLRDSKDFKFSDYYNEVDYFNIEYKKLLEEIKKDNEDKILKKIINEVKASSIDEVAGKAETYEVTAYSNHYASTGKRLGDEGYGVTASGKKTVEGITIAADWNKLPKGTVVWIDGIGERVVQDIGGAIKRNKIDVYFESEEDALEYGRHKNVKVKVIKRGGSN